MALTVDWVNKIVDSSTSILDLPAAHLELRNLESSSAGVIYPTIITYKEIDLGSGAKFVALDFVNGYKLRFPTAGNYTITGNFNATIVPISGVYVERKTSLAYVTVSGTGGSGPTADQVATAVWGHSFALTVARFIGLK